MKDFGKATSVGLLRGAAASAGVGVASAYLLVVAVTRRRVIALHDGFMLFPHGILRSSSSRIPYDTIRSVEIEPLGTKRALRVRSTKATLLIVESMLPSAAHVEMLAQELSSRSATKERPADLSASPPRASIWAAERFD